MATAETGSGETDVDGGVRHPVIRLLAWDFIRRWPVIPAHCNRPFRPGHDIYDAIRNRRSERPEPARQFRSADVERRVLTRTTIALDRRYHFRRRSTRPRHLLARWCTARESR